jgi:hypothetical protein
MKSKIEITVKNFLKNMALDARTSNETRSSPDYYPNIIIVQSNQERNF